MKKMKKIRRPRQLLLIPKIRSARHRNDAEHKSLCNWLKNQRSQMRDYETKLQSADNNYVRYPEHYHLMIESGVTGFKY
jgi:hypothetical protein